MTIEGVGIKQMSLSDFAKSMKKKCFGKNRCWENVRTQCIVAPECEARAKAEEKKKPVLRELGK